MSETEQQIAEHPLSLRIAGHLAGRLLDIAKREGNPVSTVARRVIAESLQREGDREGSTR
jgi:hypothetical protein